MLAILACVHPRSEHPLTNPESPDALLARARAMAANLEIGARNTDRAKTLLEEGLAVIATEPDPLVKGTLLLGLTPLLLGVGQDVKAVQVFDEGADLVGHDPNGVTYILEAVHKGILPEVDRLEVPVIGALILEKVLAIPKIKEDSKIALPLYATLAEFYERGGNPLRSTQIVIKTLGELRTKPNPRVLQDLLLSQARAAGGLGGTETVASGYRAAMVAAGDNLGLLFRGLGQAIGLAMDIGRYQDAVDFALIGLPIAAYNFPEDDVMGFLLQAAQASAQLGRFDLAVDSISLAILRLPQAHADWGPRVWLAASDVYDLAGDDDRAAGLLAKAAATPPALSRSVGQFAVPERMLQLGRVYGRLGNLLGSESAFRECIGFSTVMVRRAAVEVTCRLALARLLRDRDDSSEASTETQKALAAARVGVGPSRLYLGALKFDLLEQLNATAYDSILKGDPDSAEKGIGTGLTLTAPREGSATVWGLAYRALFQALELLLTKRTQSRLGDVTPLKETLAKLFEEPYLSAREIEPIFRVGRILSELGEDELALYVLGELTTRIEYVRRLLNDRQLQVSFSAARNGIFEAITNIYLRQGTQDSVLKALAVREANRARAVGAFGVPGDHAPSGEPVKGSAVDMARARLETMRRSRVEPGSREELVAAHELLSLKVYPKGDAPIFGDVHEKPSAAAQHGVVPAFDFAAFQSRLGPPVAVLVYHLSEDVSGVWVILKDSVRWRALRPLREIEEAILRFRTALLSPEDLLESRLRRSAEMAYEALIGPAASDIDEKDELVIIPDQRTFSVPFEALVMSKGANAGKYLVEKYQVSYQLSLKLLQQSLDSTGGAARRQPKLLLVGDPAEPGRTTAPAGGAKPPLPELVWAKHEIDAVMRIFGSGSTVTYRGKEARKEVLRRNLDDFTNVHFATHGVVNERYPWASYLAVSDDDGQLTLWELSNLHFSADLVVLSACESGLGRVLAGEGIWGFPSQFLASGAKNVVASLWRVEDESTAAVMQNLYRAIMMESERFATALREAKLKLLKDKRWHHPYFWAPFVLYGGADMMDPEAR